MNFKMNGSQWSIKEISQEMIREDYKTHNFNPCEQGTGQYYGVTWGDKNVIYIDKDLAIDSKKRTLKHELSHCYIMSFIKHGDYKYDEEEVCDIVSNSHDIIHKIVEDYFNKK